MPSGRANLLPLVLSALVALVAVVRPHDAVADEAPGGEIDLDLAPDFRLDDGRDLRTIAGASARRLLTPVKGRGGRFGTAQQKRYCRLRQGSDQVQWTLNDLETGEILSRSANADQLFFGASTSKIFVGAAFLDSRQGRITAQELGLLVQMIAVSNNGAWLTLQKRAGKDGTADAGRAAVQAFTRRMGYPTIQAFQGWMRRPDGSRVHGNELNSIEVAQFLRDTYERKYPGADVLWKVMQATRTGGSKIDKYTPSDVYILGKTGTYSGSNESPGTVRLPTIRARNHAAAVRVRGRYYGVTVLTNTGNNEDVAVLAGGLMREFLGVRPSVSCT